MTAVKKYLGNVSSKTPGKHIFSSAETNRSASANGFGQVVAELPDGDGAVRRSDNVGNSTAGVDDVDRVRTLILIGTALGLGAGLMCTALFAWWLSYPVRFSVGYVGDPFASEGVTGDMDSGNPMPFLAAGLIFSAVLGAVTGLIAARRGWQLIRLTA